MKKIAVIPGDGIGQEIMQAAVAVLRRTTELYGIDIQLQQYEAGGTAYDRTHMPLPEQTVRAALAADGVLFGAVGGDRWDHLPPALRPEQAVLGLRKVLGVYANLRPITVRPYLASYSPLKEEIVRGTDILIVRELAGGIYFGAREEAAEEAGKMRAWDTETYSVSEIERIARTACIAAKQRRRHVTSVDKANVLATSRLWRRTVQRSAATTEVTLDHMYVDNCAMQLVRCPTRFDVLLTSNMFGDILSDEASVLGGSIGMMPSASLGEKTGLYEPIHGSAPDIAGKNIANPCGTILAAAMLLRHSLGKPEAAAAIEYAVDAALQEGWRTADMYRDGMKRASTADMGAAVLRQLR